jgi:hypothetical protein
MQKAIVITSIFAPTQAVKRFSGLSDAGVVVVGDRKTPAGWSWPRVRYFSPAEQRRCDYRIAAALPWDHYARKMIGYLWALQNGAEILIDTDDDNAPTANWSVPAFEDEYDLIPPGSGYVNIYSAFTEAGIWPRGFPLPRIRDAGASLRRARLDRRKVHVGVWQGLVAGEPDIDAIGRMVLPAFNGFADRAPIVLGRGTVAPFNSQNTAFARDLAALMYLPGFVSFRFTDILRGYVAQPIMWHARRLLGFHRATVEQRRNAHDPMEDFAAEIPCYLNAEKIVDTVAGAVRDASGVSDNLFAAYAQLHRSGIVSADELKLLDAWLADIQQVRGR